MNESNEITTIGQNLVQARKARAWSQKYVANSAHISLITLRRIESGNPTVSIGAYAAVLRTFGMHSDLSNLASPLIDVEARIIQAGPKYKKPKYKVRGITVAKTLPRAEQGEM